jgi:cytochrome c1
LYNGTAGTSQTTGSKYLEYNPGSGQIFILNDKQRINEKQKNRMKQKLNKRMNKS